MSKLSGTNKKILPKQRIAPAVRTLVPISNWWKFKGDSTGLVGNRFFKIKKEQSEGVLLASTVMQKNDLQNEINTSGLTSVLTNIKAELFKASGNRHINGSSAQG